jgi:hypothetical protein
MRFLAGFALVLVGLACVQSQLVIPQINNLDAVISLLPQLQGFIGQLDKILPQLASVLSSTELKSLKDKVIQLVLSQTGGNLNINGLKDKLQGLFQQFLGSKPLGRIDIDAMIQQIIGTKPEALSNAILSIIGMGKRQATDARVNINELLALVDEYQLTTFIPLIEQFLGADKLQQLENQILSTIVTALGNNWNSATLAQAIQQIVTQFVPQIAQMRFDWAQLGQLLLDAAINAIPGLLISAAGKRDLGINYQQILAQLPIKNIAQLLQIVNNVDKSTVTTVLAKIRELLQNFFPAYRGFLDFDAFALAVLGQLNGLLSNLGQSIFPTNLV